VLWVGPLLSVQLLFTIVSNSPLYVEQEEKKMTERTDELTDRQIEKKEKETV